MSAQGGRDLDATLRELETREVAAFLAGDTDALTRLWHPDLIVNAPHGRLMESREDMLAAVRSGRLRHIKLDRRVEAVRWHDNCGVTMGSEAVQDDVGPLAGAPITRRYTNMWLLDESGGRLWARQAAVIGGGEEPSQRADA